ncbi:MAG: hypothetical protein LRY40_09255, partial [Shewanella fodinae]|nr:hypothetical protein [Shewanella fodinae]
FPCGSGAAVRLITTGVVSAHGKIRDPFSLSIEGKLTSVLILALLLMAAVTDLLLTWQWPLLLSLIAGGLAAMLLALLLGRRITQRINRGLQGLTTGLLNFQDNDFFGVADAGRSR